MDKFKQPFGARPDDLPTPRGASITTGLDVACGCGAGPDREVGQCRLTMK